MAIQIGQQGWSQQTPAAMQIIRQGIGQARSVVRGARSRKRKATSSTSTGRKRRKRASSSATRSSRSRKLKRLVKGSAAAKAFMAKLRAKRK